MPVQKADAQVRAEIDLPELIERFGSEDKCRDYLEALRWPEGVRCPRCGFAKVSRIVKRHQFDCDSCRYQFSVRVGTIFHDSHLPLWKWFLAVYLMVESKKGISANQVKRMLGVSYKSAWYLCHRIRAAMTDTTPEPLSGVIEMGETYVGGHHKGHKNYLVNKTMVLGALGRGGEVRLRVDSRASAKVIHEWIQETIGEDVRMVYSDQHPGYKTALGSESIPHETVDHSKEEWVRGEVSTNGIEGVWSLFKRSVVGSYHQLSAKHMDAYLDEFSFRFNNRENPYLFRDTILRLVEADPLTYQELTAE
jgi:transposase-like protein